MEAALEGSVEWMLAMLALPGVGLPAIFIVALISATLLPLGSEPAVMAYVKANPDFFWPAVLVATAGNTLGGAITYFMGRGMGEALAAWRRRRLGLAVPDTGGARSTAVLPSPDGGGAATLTPGPAAPPMGNGRLHRYASTWLHRLGPPAMLLSWLPGIGDPLCAVAGWLRFPFWASLFYMAIGKFGRYFVLTFSFLKIFPEAG